MASQEEIQNERMRTFTTGATRNVDTEREDPEGFLSWRALDAYIRYMHKNRFQRDGAIRASDNWQLGIPQSAYGKSLFRHFLSWWKTHRETGVHRSGQVYPHQVSAVGAGDAASGPAGGVGETEASFQNPELIEQCCAILFNVSGYLDQELQKPQRDAGSCVGIPQHDSGDQPSDLSILGRLIREEREHRRKAIDQFIADVRKVPAAPIPNNYPLTDDENDAWGV